jgi:hypothetical protein
MLRRATYPEVWHRKGYPESPSVPALIGEVIHKSLERVIDALAQQGCADSDSPCGFDVMKDLGGFTELISSSIEARVATLEGNPRMHDRLAALRDALLMRVPYMRQRLQSTVAMTAMIPLIEDASVSRLYDPGIGLTEGSHPEVELVAPQLRWVGRADLLTIRPPDCVITDYKTGSRDDDHVDQVRIYALLWFRDANLNPSGSLATQLVLRYPTGDRAVQPPDAMELIALEAELIERTERSSFELSKRPPAARPAEETCRGCQVRQLCPEYWEFLDTNRTLTRHDADAPQFGDVEVKVLSRHGARSWLVECKHGPGSDGNAILRTTSESTTFPIGPRQRILNAAIGRDENDTTLVLTQTSASEVFQLDA